MKVPHFGHLIVDATLAAATKAVAVVGVVAAMVITHASAVDGDFWMGLMG